MKIFVDFKKQGGAYAKYVKIERHNASELAVDAVSTSVVCVTRKKYLTDTRGGHIRDRN